MHGVIDGRLVAPPRWPNCVSSQADPSDRVHAIAPLRWSGDRDAAIERLKGLILGMERVTLVRQEGGYLHFTFKSWLFRFVDDVEFVFGDDGRLDVRSESRLGKSDLGVNRKRVETIRAAWG